MIKKLIDASLLILCCFFTEKIHAQSVPQPTNFAASRIGADSLVLTWTSLDTAQADGYFIFNGSPQSPPTDKTNINTINSRAKLSKVSDTSYTASGLTSSTPYMFTLIAYHTVDDGTTNYSTGVSAFTRTLSEAQARPPTVSILFSKQEINAGESITITANLSKDLISSVPVTIRIEQDGNTLLNATDMTRNTPTQYTYTLIIPPASQGGVATVYIEGGQDMQGHVLTQSSNTFTIIADTTPPTLQTRSPANNSINVPINTSFTITFSEPVTTTGTGSSLVLYNENNKVIGLNSPTLASPVSSLNFSFQTTQLQPGKQYRIHVPGGFFKDAAGNTMARSDIQNWSFTTFAPAEITAITSRPGTQALCINDTITITGNFLIGVTKVQFGSGSSAIGNNLISVDQRTLRVIVPAGAKIGNIIVVKAATSDNPESTSTFTSNNQIGPSGATLSPQETSVNRTAYVCSEGSTTSSPIKVDITGGLSPYTINYTIKTPIYDNPKVNNNYTSGSPISITPTVDGNNTLVLTAVKDANNCSVPNMRLTSNAEIIRNRQPIVSAGGTNAPNDTVSLCLSGFSITLNSSTLGVSPSVNISSGVQWTSNGTTGGYFNSNSVISPTYNLNTGDVLRGAITFTINAQDVPRGCEPNQDKVTVRFVGSPTANASGDNSDVKNECWNGTTNNVTVQLQGSSNGQSSSQTGYIWNTLGQSAGTFSDNTISSPTYTFSQREINDRKAKVTLVVKRECTNRKIESQPDTLEIRLVTPSSTSLSSPKINVCTGEKTNYQLINPNPSSRFEWTTSNNGGTFTLTSGISSNKLNSTSGAAEVLWGNLQQTDTLKVLEIDKNGCRGIPAKQLISIKSNKNPGFKNPEILAFPRILPIFELEPISVQDMGTAPSDMSVEFSGSGVITNGEGNNLKYYFGPEAFWKLIARKDQEIRAGKTNIYYRYKIISANCYTPIDTVVFTVYDGSRAFDLFKITDESTQSGEKIRLDTLSGLYNYEICADQPIKITLNTEFSNANPLREKHSFKGFTVHLFKGRSITSPLIKIINTPASQRKDKAPFKNIKITSKESTALLYPNRLNIDSMIIKQEGEPLIFEINGWETPDSDLNDIRGYGKILIQINPVPTATPRIPEDPICSSSIPVSLTRVEVSNPNTKYSFSVEDTPNLVGGDTKNGFFLYPGNVFKNIETYTAPKNIAIKYTYTDPKGCTSSKNFTTTITQTPQTPIIVDINGMRKNDFCTTSSNVSVAVIDNRASFDKVSEGETEPKKEQAVVKWYNAQNVVIPNVGKDDQFKPETSDSNKPSYLDVNKNGNTDFYVTQALDKCQSSSVKFTYEVVNVPPFSWNKSCIDNKKATFNIDVGAINADNLIWYVASDNYTETKKKDEEFQYIFKTVGQHPVRLTIESRKGCASSRTDTVVMLQSINLKSGEQFSQNFDQTNGNFFSQSSPSSVKKRNTWAYGLISDPKDQKRENESPVWATNLNGPYGNGERSYLYIGCVNLAELALPVISFDTWINVNESIDGMVLQYSIDNLDVNNPNKSWKAVGGLADELNWYNKQLIQSIPNNPVENYGWSEENNEWKTIKHTLDKVKKEQGSDIKKLILRFAFAAVEGSTKKQSGIALDNFSIGQRDRVVLVENFTNKSSLAIRSDEIEQSRSIDSFLPDEVGENLVKINYHLGFPIEEPFNMDEREGSSSRAFLYGIKIPPTAVVGGNRPKENSNGKTPLFSQWGEREYSIHTLDPSRAKIKMEVSPPNIQENHRVAITVQITPESHDISKNTKLYIAIVEDSINRKNLPTKKETMLTPGEEYFRYVFKKMLPSPVGKQVGPLPKSKTEHKYGPFYWYPDANKLYSKSVSVVAILQDEITKNVYQVGYKKGIDVSDVITAVDEPGVLNHQIRVYPNPASQYLKVHLPYSIKDDTPLQLISPTGIVVNDAEVIPAGETMQQINIGALSEGVYILKITPPNTAPIYKKVLIVHSNP